MQISPAFRRMLFCQYSQRSPAAVLECIRIRVGYVWTGQFDLNMDMDTCRRVDVEILNPEERFRIQKYTDTCGLEGGGAISSN